MNFRSLDQMKAEPQRLWKLSYAHWGPMLMHSESKRYRWDELSRLFPEYQLYLFSQEGDVMGLVNTVPIRYEGPLKDLPDTGWDWLISQAIFCLQHGMAPNLLGGLQIVVLEKFRRKGLSKFILQRAKQLIKEKQLSGFVLPIRPTWKEKYPQIPMTDYLAWKENGRIFDPWIRTHLQAGCELIKVCERSMTTQGTGGDLRRWYGNQFVATGNYALPGELSMVHYDAKSDRFVYHEPNIWISYPEPQAR